MTRSLNWPLLLALAGCAAFWLVLAAMVLVGGIGHGQ